MLLSSIEPGAVQLGQSLETVIDPDDGPLIFTFSDGTTDG